MKFVNHVTEYRSQIPNWAHLVLVSFDLQPPVGGEVTKLK